VQGPAMTLLSSYEQYDESESVTDTSEDSVEVRVNPVERKEKNAIMSTPSKKNKRKSMEPRKMMTDSSPMQVAEPTKRCRLNSTGSEDRSPPVSYNSESRSPSPSSPSSSPSSPPSKESKRTSTSPLHLAPKKRFKFDALKDLEEKEKMEEAKSSGNPFRPWSSEEASSSPSPPPSVRPAGVLPLHPFLGPAGLPLLPLDPRLYGYLPAALPPYLPIGCPPASPPEQDEPLCLVKKEPKAAEPTSIKPSSTSSSPQKRANPSSTKGSPSKRQQQPALTSQAGSRPAFNVEAIIRAGGMAALRQPHASSNPTSTSPRTRNDSGSTSSSGGDDPRSKQRNYKNMTRERRVEANARERQRVHTITAAFDNLQGAIPTEEENVKLSKLSVIKIATAYIMALSRMAGHDYTEDQSAPPVEEVIKQCSEVIEAESRIKKRSSH